MNCTSNPLAPRSRLFIVDDHPMMRLGLSQFLAQEPDFALCGEAADAGEAIDAVSRFRPNLVLVDISLEGRSGLDLIKDLRARFPEIRVLVHSMHDEMVFAGRALRAGAHGYVMKQEASATILAAVRQVLRGETFLSPRARKAMVAPDTTLHPGAPGSPVTRLTDREFEVFRLIGCGHVNQEIARRLHISLKTVDAHRERIKRKLGVASSTALNLLAVRWAASENSF